MNHYATEMFINHAGRHYWFAKKLEQRGYSPTVFTASSFHNKPEGIDTEGKRFKIIYTDDTPFVFVRVTPSTGNGFARIRNMLQFFFRLFPTAKSYAATCGKPDVIIGSSVHPLTMVAALLIARRMKVPCICEIRDLWPEAIFTFGKTKPNSLLGRILTAGEHWIYRKADALIFTKEGDTDYIKEKRWDTDHGGDVDLAKCHYINNGVDIPAYDLSISTQTMRDSELDDPDAFNVVYAGIIRPVNNVGNLLDTAALLKGYPRIRFLIYGDGDQLPQLRQRVKDEHLTNVSLKGHVERRFIPYILSRSSVNILNYSQNQFNWTRGNSSNKLFEYLASGKPVISTVRMGYSIINRWKCGFETEQCTARSLADAILRIYSMPEEQYRQLGINARTAAMQFDFERLTDRLVSVIDSVTDDTTAHTVSR
ncbi:MAG: glycosyltransferase family 4 protein [Ruminococcaceae bacterium]|nr:glycosyltransferase family 4 protein [Oscillospiraceae bacterium]